MKSDKKERKETRLKITERRDEKQYHRNDENEVEAKFVCHCVVL